MRPNTKTNPFLGSLRAVAIAIGKRDHVKIVFEGTGAKTNGRTIFLPATLPADDQDMEVLLRGFLDHEVGHVKHTNFGLQEPPHRLIHTLTNIVEDIRIEQLMGHEYPGCALNLRELVSYMKSTGKMSFKDKTNAIGATLMAISYGARSSHLKNDLVEEAANYRRLAGKHLGKKALSVIDMAIAKSGCLTSTQDSRDLAQKVYDLLKEVSQEPPPPPPQPEQSKQSDEKKDDKDGEGQGGKGEPGKDDQQGNQEDKNGSDQQDEDHAEPSAGGPAGEGEDNDGHQSGQDGAAGEEGEDQPDSTAESGDGSGCQQGHDSNGPAGDKPEPGPTDKQRQNLEKLLDASQADLDQTQQNLDVAAQVAEKITSDSCDAAHDGRSADADSNGNTGEVAESRIAGTGGGEFIQLAAQKTVGLRGKLAGLFQSSKLKRDNPQLNGYKLDRRAIHRVVAMTPDTRIFQQRIEKVADNTAIAIIVDRSGSMEGQQISLATASAYSVTKAIESMPGVKCAVAAFPNANRGVIRLKDFSEKPAAARFAVGASGGTPLDVALRWAGQKLWPRQENRKIVLVLTDGDPDSRAKTSNMISLLTKNNIECYGIGIGSETKSLVRALFGQHSKAIASIEELAGAMFDTITAAVTRH